MTVRRLIAMLLLLALSPALGACSQFPGYVADHWPHWAGGLPADAPPRPGAPGYNEFISHGLPPQDTGAPTAAPQTSAASPGAAAQTSQLQPPPAATGTVTPVFQRTPGVPARTGVAPAPQPALPAEDADGDGSAVRQGGLY